MLVKVHIYSSEKKNMWDIMVWITPVLKIWTCEERLKGSMPKCLAGSDFWW